MLASGCSFTEENWAYDKHGVENHAMWPQLIGEKLGFDQIINVGRGGYANTRLIRRAVNSIDEDTDLIVIGLTEIDRVEFKKINLIFCDLAIDKNFNEFSSKEDYEKYALNNYRLKATHDYVINNLSYESLQKLIDEFFQSLIDFKRVCDDKNIPVIFVSMLTTNFEPRNRFAKLYNIDNEWTEKNFAKAILNSKHFDVVSDYNIMGWPFTNLLGGFSLDQFLSPDMRYSKTDFHPNAEGQKLIANKIYNFIKGKFK